MPTYYNNMKQIIIVFGLILGLTAWTGVSAADFEAVIGNIKTEYAVGDNLSFNFKIANNTGDSVMVNYLAYILCQSRPMPLLVKRSAMIEAKGQFSGSFNDGKVVASDKAQACLAYVQITRPQVARVVKPFKIKNLPDLDFSLDLTGGVNCPKNPSLFSKTSCSQGKGNLITAGNQILLNPVLPVSGSQTVAVLVYPDGTRQTLSLPWVLTPTQAGAYSLEITATKTGYLSKRQVFGFAVLDNKPTIGVESLKAVNSGMGTFNTYQPNNLY